MSNNRKIIIILLSGLLVIVGIISYFIYIQRATKDNFSDLTRDESAPIPVAGIDEQLKGVIINEQVATKEEKTTTELEALARTFFSRFGTYSNQSGYSNFSEISSLMTDSFRAYVFNDYVKKLQMYYPADGYYYEVKSEPLVINVKSQTETMIEFLITYWQTQQNGDKAPVSGEKEVTLKMVKVGERWLVDGIFWQNDKE
ncbi:MAG: hypothetical protein WCT18_03680 [Patescibacteria group bacterium]